MAVNISSKDSFLMSSNKHTLEQNHLAQSYQHSSKLSSMKQIWGTTVYCNDPVTSTEEHSSSQVPTSESKAAEQRQKSNHNKASQQMIHAHGKLVEQGTTADVLLSKTKYQHCRKSHVSSNSSSRVSHLRGNRKRSQCQTSKLQNCHLTSLSESAISNLSTTRISKLPVTCSSVNRDKLSGHEISCKKNKHSSHSNLSDESTSTLLPLPHSAPGTSKGKRNKGFTNTENSCSLINYPHGEYKRSKNYPVFHSCNCKKLKCGEKLSETWQRQLYCKFWSSYNFNIRTQWILKYIVGVKNKDLPPHTKNVGCRKWFMADSSGRVIHVCRSFFLRTLAYKWDSVLYMMLKDAHLPSRRICPSLSHHVLKHSRTQHNEHSIRRLVFMHIKSFLSKYHSPTKKTTGSQRHVYDYNLVKRCLHSFTATCHHTVSYTFFRTIFYAVFFSFIVDYTCLSIMPNSLLLSQAYQNCDLLGVNQKNAHSITENPLNGPKTRALSVSIRKRRNDPVMKVSEKYWKQNEKEKDKMKVIMHLAINNDAVVITENASGSDTEIEDKTSEGGVRKHTLRNQKNHSTHKKIKLIMEHIKEGHPLLTSCSCRRQCCKKLSETRRKEIYTFFWELKGFVEQKQWITKHIQKSKSKRRGKGRKRSTRTFILTDEANKPVMVCAVFFQRTLGFTDSDWVDALCESSSRGVVSSSCVQVGQAELLKEVTQRRCVEQHINMDIDNFNKKADNTQAGISSRGRSLNKSQTTHANPPGNFDRFQAVHYEALSSSVDHLNRESVASGRQSSRCKELRKCRKSLVACNDSEMPKRRRSTRATRMQGSMAEDDLLELGGKSCVISPLVSSKDDQYLKNNSPSTKFEIHQNYSIQHIPKRSNKLARSECVNDQHNVSYQGHIQNRVRQSPTSEQSMDKSALYPEHKNDRKMITQSKQDKMKSHITSNVRRKKKKESNNYNSLLSNRKTKTETRHDSKKKLCKLSSLKTLKKKHKHPILPACNCSRRKCIDNIPEERRKAIHEHFWNLSSYKDRKQWLMKHVQKCERKVKVLSLFPQRKNESKKYFLPDKQSQTVEVCRLFFIHTLGFRWDSVIDAIVRSKTPSNVLVQESHNLKKPVRQLPEYIVDSVKEYLKCIRDSRHITKDSKNSSGIKEEGDGEGRSEDLHGLKVKDLFKGWKVKYKTLKFNLGYHSFRRIFQSVIDPVVSSKGEAAAENHEKHSSDVETLDDDDVNDKVPTPLPLTDMAYTRNGLHNHLSVKAGSYTETISSELVFNLNAQAVAKSTDTPNELSTFSITEPIKVGGDSVSSVYQDDKASALDNAAICGGEHSAGTLPEDNDDYVLDVGSGYFKQVGSGDKHYPYTYEYTYKKRRSLSMRNDRTNYPVLPPCKCRKRKCAEKLTEVQRQKINDMFWNLGSYNERKQWILEHIKRADIKRRVVFSEGTPRKLESRWYYLPNDDGSKVDVCKAFFLRTLGYRWDSVIDTIGKTTPKGEKWIVPDKRGRKPPPHKINEEAVGSMTLYIENVCHTYQPLHQSKNQNNKKGCKPSTNSLSPYGLTMKQLFEDYKSKHPNHKFGYESFRKVFRRVHGAFLASLPSDLKSSKEPEQVYSSMVDSIGKAYCGSTNIECSGTAQSEVSHFIPATEAYTYIHYTSPPPPPLPPPPPPIPPPPPPATHHQPPHQQQTGNSAPERRSCLYQYSNQPCESHQLQPLPAMHVPDDGGPLPHERYNSVDRDPFVKYSHNLYCPPTGMSGHFPQMGDHLGYNGNVNPRTDRDPTSCGGQNQFQPYFMQNPEPLRRQVYQMASQYQSILHQIAESSRFFNYGGFPPQDATFQGGHEKQYPYVKQQDFHRDNMNSYTIPKIAQSYVSESTTMPIQYPLISDLSHNNMQQGSTAMILSPYSDENDNSFSHNHNTVPCVTRDQDLNNSFDHDFPAAAKDKKSSSKGRITSKKAKVDKQRVKKEKKLKPKSSRNYGDHYPMLSPCHCKKKKCTEKFSENDRRRIHDMFWDLKDYNERKQWMLLRIKREGCKRRRIDQFESFRKQESRWYFFPDEDGNQQEVCKDFFLKTLGYKWDSVIDTIRRTTPKGETSTRPDQRGRKAPAHKLSASILRSVIQYIESMQQVSQPVVVGCVVEGAQLNQLENPSSNQVSKGASGVQVSIPYGLTMKDLYDDYKVKHAGHKIGYESFRRIFRALSKSEKFVFDDRSTDEDFLNPDNQHLIDF